jgi:uroporphyrinogen III methyltransferase/synthase
VAGAERSALAGRTILVARAPDAARSWVEELSDRGARAAARETFTLESMLGQAAAQAAIDRIEEWRWILVTSQNGLRFLVRGLASRSISVAELAARFGVVGPQTARALERLGRQPDAIADPPNGAGLAVVLEGRIAAEEPVLVVAPEDSRPELRQDLAARGVDVHAVPFYRNRPAADVSSVAAECADGNFDAAVFGSPSAFLHLFSACGPHAAEVLGRIPLVAIGGTTAQTIRDQGCGVAAVAAEPTPVGIADAVEAVLSD